MRAGNFKIFKQCVQQGSVSRHRKSADVGMGVAQPSLSVRAGYGCSHDMPWFGVCIIMTMSCFLHHWELKQS